MKSLILRILPLLVLTSVSRQIIASNSMTEKLVTSIGIPTKLAATYAAIFAGTCAVYVAYNFLQTRNQTQKATTAGTFYNVGKTCVSTAAAASFFVGGWFSPTVAATSLALSATDIITDSWSSSLFKDRHFIATKLSQIEQTTRTLIALPVLIGAAAYFMEKN